MNEHRDEHLESRLSAYALGELPDDERAAVEAEIAASEEAAREVEGLRAMATELEAALAAESSPGLDERRRESVLERRSPRPRRPRLLVLRSFAAAAAVVFATLLGWAAWTLHQGTAETAPFTYPIGGSRTSQWNTLSVAPPAEEAYELDGLGYSSGDESEDAPMVIVGLGGGAGGTYGGRGIGGGRRSRRAGGYVGVSAEVLEEPAASSTEEYAHIRENRFTTVANQPRSTFSIDVDTASYANVRRFLREGRLPPADAVRIEELVNYFAYDYPEPTGGDPFSITVDAASAPWAPSHRLVRIGLRGRSVPVAERAPSNLVFLLDVSGSMDSPRKLPLVKRAMRLLVDQLDGRDSVALAVYAGAAGLVLPPRPARIGPRSWRPSRTSRPAARPTAARASASPTAWRATATSRAASTA